MSGPVPETGPRCVNPDCRKIRRKRTGQPGYEGGRGYCRSCYDRARDAGFPAVVPPLRTAGDGLAARLREQESWPLSGGSGTRWLRDNGLDGGGGRRGPVGVSSGRRSGTRRWYQAQREAVAA